MVSNRNIPKQPWRRKLYIIIFEADTTGGKVFDIILLIFIFISILAIILNSVENINKEYGALLSALEWGFTFAFTIEYIFRLICVKRALKYVKSFFGIIDLLAVLPSYIAFFIPGAPSAIVLRVIRLLRVFVVFKLGRYVGQANFLLSALKKGFRKIIIFVGTVLTIVVIMGALMYLIEGPENGFYSIPKAMYWAIVTLTTVGYGDIAPRTVVGQTIAATIMLLGYGIIAVPTGILSAEIAISARKGRKICKNCGKTDHESDSKYCRFCGKKLKSKK